MESRRVLLVYNVLLINILLVTLALARVDWQLKSNFIAYDPTWESLDSRPLPKWYDEAKIGIFLHWGVFSVPSFGSEWFWSSWKNRDEHYVNYMSSNFPPSFTYQDFAKDFTTEFFNPEEWAELFKNAGAKYVVLTSKHHEGYTLWPSRYSFSWNSKDVGPNRDLVGELATAIRNKTDLHFGLYHSMFEWYNPIFLDDKASNYSKANFVHNKILPEMVELVNNYKPDVIWSDGDWEATDQYWQSKEFLAWLYNESPVKDVVVVNDRWGKGIPCHHGGYFTCTDRYNPGVLQLHKWENAMTIDKESWGYRRNAKLSDYLTTFELLTTVVQTVSCGGNILINVGPTKDGMIAPIFEERLLDLGKWLSINGEAIYGSKPWKYQNDTIGNTWYTAKDAAVYAITLNWPDKNVLKLKYAAGLFKNSATTATLLGNSKLKWLTSQDEVDIIFPDRAVVKSDWVWVIKITNS